MFQLLLKLVQARWNSRATVWETLVYIKTIRIQTNAHATLSSRTRPSIVGLRARVINDKTCTSPDVYRHERSNPRDAATRVGDFRATHTGVRGPGQKTYFTRAQCTCDCGSSPSDSPQRVKWIIDFVHPEKRKNIA